MATVQQTKATLDDLYRTPEKAELIGGRIVTFMATGRNLVEWAVGFIVAWMIMRRNFNPEKRFPTTLALPFPSCPPGAPFTGLAA